MRARAADIFRLFRIHTGLVTAALPGLAAYILGGGPISVILVVLGALAHHAWGFSLNEIVDLDIDRRSGELSEKPLVSGRIKTRAAVVLSITALIISFLLFAGAAVVEGMNVLPAMVFLFLASASGTVYDLWGKRFPFSDIFVALWIFLIVISAAAVSGGWGPYVTAVWAIAALGFLHILFNNSVEGGLKDADGDRRSGARTLAVITGCTRRSDEMIVPLSFRTWGFLLRGAFVISGAAFAFLIAEEHGWNRWTTLATAVIGIVLFSHSFLFLKERFRSTRDELIRKFSIHEISSYAMSLLVILPAAGVLPITVAFIGPFLWFFMVNRLIYGSGISPGV